MKTISLLIAIALILGFCYMIHTAFERTYNLECEYYQSLEFPTELMRETCPNLK